MAQTAKWEGILPAVTTKFKEDGSLDTAEMERCYRLNIDAGVDGLIVCGSLGEASTLDPDEKLEVLKVARSVAGQRPVLLTVSDGSTRNAQPMLDIDVSTKLVQNIKLAEAIAIGSNDRCRPPRLPLAGAERARIASIVEEGIRRRPKLPALRMAAE